MGNAGAAARAEDRQAIANLVHSYAELLDGGDIAGAAALFERATLRTDGAPQEIRGADEVRALLDESVQRHQGSPGTKHLITNLIVEVDDEGPATARCYFTVLQALPDLALQPILAGRWHDRFERDDGTWWLTDRLVHVDLVGDLRFHIKGVPA